MVADWYNDTVYLTAITEGIHRLQVFKSKTDQSLLDTVLTAFKNPIIKANWFPFQEHHGRLLHPTMNMESIVTC